MKKSQKNHKKSQKIRKMKNHKKIRKMKKTQKVGTHTHFFLTHMFFEIRFTCRHSMMDLRILGVKYIHVV